MKMTMEKDVVVLIPETDYDKYLIGKLTEKFENSVTNFVSDSHSEFSKIENMKFKKEELFKYLEISRIFKK